MMGRLRKTANLIVAAAMAGGLSYCSYNFVSAEPRMRATCDRIRPGMTMEELRAFALENGLSRPSTNIGTSYLVEGKTFGRFGCKVITEGGVVKTVNDHFMN